jgi:hypothetical protein
MGTGEVYRRLGSPGREKDSPKYEHRKVQMGFRLTSVILCHSSVGAVAYVETKCVLNVKLLSVPKKDPCKVLAISTKFLASRRYYSRVFGHRNKRLLTE